MNYEAARMIRRLAETVAKNLGHCNPPDVIDPEPDYHFCDGVLRIYSKPQAWVEICARNAEGHYSKALEVGGLLCKGNDDLMYANLDRLRALAFASHPFFLKTINQPEPANQQGVN